MSFDTLLSRAMEFASTAPGSEEVDFRIVTEAGGEGAWQPVRAIVEPGTPEDEDTLGRLGRRGEQPIRVLLFKHEVASVVPEWDEIRWKGTIYRILEVLREDAGSLSVYARK